MKAEVFCAAIWSLTFFAVAATTEIALDKGVPAGFAVETCQGGEAPQGGRFVANPARKGIAPDGNAYAAADFVPARRQTFTAQAFVRCEPTGAFGQVMTQRRGNGSSWSLSVDPDGRLMSRFDLQRAGVCAGDGFNTLLGTTKAINDGHWHHVALVVDESISSAALFCDYELAASHALRGKLVYETGAFRIGQGLSGELRGVRLDDAALGADDFACAPWFLRTRLEKTVAPTPVAYDGTYTRVQTGVCPPLARIGALIPKKVNEMSTSRLSLGCECVERDLASWDAYKDYLPLLGIRKIRVQGGWFRTEKKKGVYDFEWLDHIVDDAHARGLEVCLETSYNNPLYGNRCTGPGGALPLTNEELAGWDRWVEASVRHFAPKGVKEWMMYNEPNLKLQTNTYERILANNLRTAEIIKRIDPEAKVAAFVLAGLNYGPITNMLTKAKAAGKDKLFDYAVFHGYAGVPERLDEGERKLVAWLRENTPHIRAWQGEAGCASEEVQYALSGVAWTEFSQAKWNGRRMLSDLECGVDTLLFTISDLSYSKSFISRYGLLKTNPDNSIIRVKNAFYSAQNIVSIFNDALTVENSGVCVEGAQVNDKVKAIRFRDRASGSDVVALWNAANVPGENRETANCVLRLANGKMEDPVWIDLVNGQIWEIPADAVQMAHGALVLSKVPYYDGPAAVLPRNLLNIEKPKVYKRRAAPNVKAKKLAVQND